MLSRNDLGPMLLLGPKLPRQLCTSSATTQPVQVGGGPMGVSLKLVIGSLALSIND